MSTLAKAKKPAWKPRRRALWAVPGSPLAGLEHMVGCVSIDLPPAGPARRACLNARIRADHNT